MGSRADLMWQMLNIYYLMVEKVIWLDIATRNYQQTFFPIRSPSDILVKDFVLVKLQSVCKFAKNIFGLLNHFTPTHMRRNQLCG